MEQRALKNVNNCFNTNFCSYLETSGGQSSKLSSMLFIFSMPVVIRDLWQLKTVAFLHWCLLLAVLFDEIVQNTKICTNLLQKEFYKMSCMRRRRLGTQHNDIQHNDKNNIKNVVISKMTISTTIFRVTTVGLKFSTTKLDAYVKCRCAICHLCWMSSIIPLFRVPLCRMTLCWVSYSCYLKTNNGKESTVNRALGGSTYPG